MRPLGRHGIGLMIATAACGLAAGARGADLEPAARTVIVELFTSQGCSSCPPADRLLPELATVDRAAGLDVEVVPLAFHVDYWDGIGWPDPFASPDWTARQRRYAAWLGDNRIYTPQLIAGGGRHAVGSNRDQVEALIGWAAHRPQPLAVDARARLDGDRLEVEIGVRATSHRSGDEARVAEQAAVMVAVFDGGHETSVERGENARRTLFDERVVRVLDEVARYGGPQTRADWSTRVDASWRRPALGVAVFVQDLRSGAILGASAPVIDVRPAAAGTVDEGGER